MVSFILLVLLMRSHPENLISQALSTQDLSFSISGLQSQTIPTFPQNIDKKPGFTLRTLTEISSFPYSTLLLSSQMPLSFTSLLIIVIAISLGFFIGNLNRNLASNPKQSEFPSENSSKASTSFSPFRSPIYTVSSCESFEFPPIFSHSSLDDLIDNGSFVRNFKQELVIFDSEKFKIFKAQHKLDSQMYLVKVIPVSINLMQDFKEQELFEEIEKVKKLGCRHITRYVTCWVEADFIGPFEVNAEVLLYVQMEFIEGVCLEERIKQEISLELCVKVVRTISKVLDYIHCKGIRHGNIRLSNIYINKYNWVTLGDFDFTEQGSDDLQGLLNVIKILASSLPEDSQATLISEMSAISPISRLRLTSL